MNVYYISQEKIIWHIYFLNFFKKKKKKVWEIDIRRTNQLMNEIKDMYVVP